MTGKSVKKKCFVCSLCIESICLSALWFLCPTPSSLPQLYRLPFSFLLFLSLPPSLRYTLPSFLCCSLCVGGSVLVCTLSMVCIVSLSFSVLGCWTYSFSYCVLWLIFPISLYYNKICQNKSELPDSSNTKMRRTKEKQGSGSGKEKTEWKKQQKTQCHNV